MPVRRSTDALVLPVPPSANVWWRKWKNRMVLSAEARQYKADMRLLVRGQKCIVAPAPVRVTVRWFRARKSGDLDKRLGVLLDALQGVCYENDSQIVELHAYRADDGRGRVEVQVEAA